MLELGSAAGALAALTAWSGKSWSGKRRALTSLNSICRQASSKRKWVGRQTKCGEDRKGGAIAGVCGVFLCVACVCVWFKIYLCFVKQPEKAVNHQGHAENKREQ